ncbi:hypothetical protein J4Q44_G00243550 [Coregonus suidteri]|uniref:Uncharacterized protein n=1 Tax=Coregonus suidteri TaxID=861788 RepID=A0AAN8LFG2_9TELE
MNCRGLRAHLKDSVPVTGLQAGSYGVQDTFRSGFSSVRNELLPSPPLELSEKKTGDLSLVYNWPYLFTNTCSSIRNALVHE